MKFDQIHIIAPKDSPNTNGIHISSSSNIQILDSTIATGDDCVSMSPSSKNINIRNVTCGSGHGISVGSLGGGPNEEDVSGLMVTNCTFIVTQNGLRVKTWARSYTSNVFNLTFEDIIMDNVNNPIIIDQQYCPSRKCEKVPNSCSNIVMLMHVCLRFPQRFLVMLNICYIKFDLSCWLSFLIYRVTRKFRFVMLSTKTLGASLAQKLQLLLTIAKANLVRKLSLTTLT